MNLKRIGAAAVAFVSVMIAFVSSAFAQTAAAEAGSNEWSFKAAVAIAIGLGLGISVIGGALAQGRAAAAALEGIGRNPAASKEIFTPLLLSLALIESLVIYSLVIAFMLLGKLA
jgi:F-type H+-transporting ATPase subunit c